MIGRAGLVPTGFNANLGIGASFEGRYYSSIKRRMEMGRSTYNNSSDFISLRLRTNTTGDGPEISLTPAYGFRRTIGKHWVQEFTLGLRFGIFGDDPFFAPHAQYRIGFVL